MKNLNEVVESRLRERINRGKQVATTVVQRIADESMRSKDSIGFVGKGQINNPPLVFDSNGVVRAILPGGDGVHIHPHAVGQLGEKLGVPVSYLKSLATGSDHKKALAAKILNDHSSWAQQDRLLLRMVGDELRGVVSDRYRRLNTMMILSAFLSASQEQGGEVADAHFTDTKLFVEVLQPKPLIFPTHKNGDVAIAFGARLSSSDYGDGALDLRFFFMQGICLNGMVRESIFKEIHLGAKLPYNLALSEKTYMLDTETTASAIQDMTGQLFSPARIQKQAEEIQDASAEEVDLVKELAVLTKNGQILKSEAGEVQRILMGGKADDGIQGENTLWKLTQGISAHSREVAPARARELQEVAGNLFKRLK